MSSPKILLIVLLQWTIARVASDCSMEAIRILGSMYGMERIKTVAGEIPQSVSIVGPNVYYRGKSNIYRYTTDLDGVQNMEQVEAMPGNKARVKHIKNKHSLYMRLWLNGKYGTELFRMTAGSSHELLVDTFADITMILNNRTLYALPTADLNNLKRMSYSEEVMLGGKTVLDFAIDKSYGNIVVGGHSGNTGFLYLLKKLSDEFKLTPQHHLRSILTESYSMIVNDLNLVMNRTKVTNLPTGELMVTGSLITKLRSLEAKLVDDKSRLDKSIIDYFNTFNQKGKRVKRDSAGDNLICHPETLVEEFKEKMSERSSVIDSMFTSFSNEVNKNKAISDAMHKKYEPCYGYEKEPINCDQCRERSLRYHN